MNKKLLFVLLLFLLINIAAVSAQDANSDNVDIAYNQSIEQNDNEEILDDAVDDLESSSNHSIQKTTPSITINSKNIKSKDTIEIYLKTLLEVL